MGIKTCFLFNLRSGSTIEIFLLSSIHNLTVFILFMVFIFNWISFFFFCDLIEFLKTYFFFRMPWTYTWIALHISSAVFPAFRKVMARFLARFASSNVTLFDPFCVIFCLLEERSMAGPWAFVLNISSNSSTFKSWGREERRSQIRLYLKIKLGESNMFHTMPSPHRCTEQATIYIVS